MNKINIAIRQLNKYKDVDRLTIYKQCVEERLIQSLSNYNADLNSNLNQLEFKIDEYWKRQERKYK